MAKTETIVFRSQTYHVEPRDAEMIAWILTHHQLIPTGKGEVKYNFGENQIIVEYRGLGEPIKIDA